MSTWSDLLEGKTAISLSPRAVWKFTGADRVRYLNGQVTNDVAKLAPGQTLHAAVTNAKGRMDGEVWISARPDALWVDAPLELRETLGPRLERYIIADDVTLEDQTGQWTLVHILGGAAGPEGLPSARYRLPGHDLWLSAGQEPPLPLADPSLVEALRIRQAVPLWGRDMNAQTLPPEAALERDAISYGKGCYIGQEVIARIKSVGHVNKKLARFTAETATATALPAEVHAGGKPIGHLTSVCANPEGPGLIGLGTVARTTAEQGGGVLIGESVWTVKPL